MKVGFIGVGKLGQPCAEVMAEHYFVEGYDIEERNPDNFSMVSSIKEVVKDKDLIFLAIQTPHDSKYGGETPASNLKPKDFEYSLVCDLLKDLNNYVNKNQLVVLISTTLPGTVRNLFVPLITNARFIYNPYLIAMGSVKWDMVNPEMVIIGTEDGDYTTDADILINFYKKLMGDQRYIVGTWDEAECIKIFYNTFISAKLSIINMIQDVAERSGNINTDIVTKALADSTYRITSPAYMTAGMGDGGPCHPRDNIALRYLSEKLDLKYDIFQVIIESREEQAKNLAKFIYDNNIDGQPIIILGKSYKPGVEYTAGSYSLLIGHYLEELGINVHYDNNINDNPATYLLGHKNTFNHKNFKFNYASTIIDPWRELIPNKNRKDLEIIHYGNTRTNV